MANVEDAAYQCNKKKGSVGTKENNKLEEDGGKEAPDPGALGELVGAAGGAHQEP